MQVLSKGLFLFILMAALFSFSSKGQDIVYPKASLSSPRDTMNYFLKTMKGHKLGDPQALDLAVLALNISGLDKATSESQAKLKAQQLINTLDRLEYIDVSTIPAGPSTNEWIYRKGVVTLNDETYPVEISIAKDQDDKWRFTPETLKNIAYYERSLLHKKTVKGVTELKSWRTTFISALPQWSQNRSFVLLNWQWFAIFLIIFLGVVLQKLLRIYLGALARRFLGKKNVTFSKDQQKKLTAPMGVMIFSGIWIVLIRFIELEDAFLGLSLRAGQVAFTVATVVATHHLVDALCYYLGEKAERTRNKFDDILIPLIRKSLKFFVIAVGIIFIGDSLTLDMKGIIAGLGIGGLAFALAAKDTISNIFGSLTVLLDRPFSIGDWVVIDGNIEGMVEEVGLRSTRIRTFYNSLITLPNGKLTNAHIDNYGMREYRRFSTTIGIQYDTPPEKVEAFCEGIRQIILTHKWTRKDSFHVYFNGLGNSSLDILLYVFWKVPDWSQELNERHRLLIDILRLGNKMGVQFAFPTQTLHLFQEEKAKAEKIDGSFSPYSYGSDLGKEIASQTLTMSKARSSAPEGHFSNDQPAL